MDRSGSFSSERAAAVSFARTTRFHLLLSAASGERGEPALAAPARRTLSGVSLLRQPQDGRATPCESEAHAEAHAPRRDRGAISQAESQPSGAGSSDPSLSAARRTNRETKPCLEHRYYVHSDAWRLSLSGGCDGLVQPLRAQLGTVQHYGDRLLSDRARRRFRMGQAGDLQLRSGCAV